MSHAAEPNGGTIRCKDCGGPTPRGRICADCLADSHEEAPTTGGGGRR